MSFTTPHFVLLLTVLALPVSGCDRAAPVASAQHQSRPAGTATGTTGEAAASPASADVAPVGSRRPRVVFLGDSLTAGFGVDADQAFPAVIGQMLARDGVAADIVNAGVSGDTTAGGLRRLDWQLRQKPDVVVVGLGGNDGLRGLDVAEAEHNLREIVRKSRDAGADVLLLGMMIPPNYGPDYAGKFREVYPRVAREMNVPLVPFLLAGVGGDPKLNQGDGIHPTAAGHEIVAQNVEPAVRTIVEQRLKRLARPATAPTP